MKMLNNNIQRSNSQLDQIKDLKQQLKEKDNSFKNLLDITMEAIIIVDENHVIEDINKSGLILLKPKTKSQIIGRSLIELLMCYSVQKLHNSMLSQIEEPYELDLKKSSGEKFPALISSKESTIDGRMVRIVTILDLTQIKEKDRQLAQQSRLAQMGEMISMIAHQWRQPLNAISTTSSNLHFKLIMNDVNHKEFQKEIELINKYSQHLSKTIDDFRRFFKKNKDKEITTLDDLVTSTLSITKTSIDNKNIKIITNLKCDTKFETYPNEIKQVILNIVKNAEDALFENKIKNPTITINTLCNQNKGTKEIIIKDNANGIPDDIKEKIFDPYFSTKRGKEGTGLGLYMSKTIIEDHCGGRLYVQNDQDGAIFTIRLSL